VCEADSYSCLQDLSVLLKIILGQRYLRVKWRQLKWAQYFGTNCLGRGAVDCLALRLLRLSCVSAVTWRERWMLGKQKLLEQNCPFTLLNKKLWWKEWSKTEVKLLIKKQYYVCIIIINPSQVRKSLFFVWNTFLTVFLFFKANVQK